MLSSHPSAKLEYWFFKVNSGPVALLVDWIARRQTQEQWLRVSIHTADKQEVLFEKHALPWHDERNFLSTERWWISANQFDRAGIAVECCVFRSSLWGTSITIPLA